MSRRRRRDDGENESINSENDSFPGRVGAPARSVNQADSDEDLDVSEYESVDEEAQHSIDEEYEDQEATDEPVDHQEAVEDKKEDADVEEEEVSNTKRESGDGKEQSDNEQIKQEGQTEDDDDDKKRREEEEDPAFIPTKGAFFQHDLRSDNSGKGRGRDRKIWDKGPVKWSHDMFVMEEQMPKTRDILISNYGYDIRTKDKAPTEDTRRPRGRGRGRGGYRGRGRGRQSNQPHERQQNDYNGGNNEYVEDFPELGENSRRSTTHKSRSFYKRDLQPNQQASAGEAQNKSRSQTFANKEQPENKENARQRVDSNFSTTDESKTNEKFSDILQVINSRENTTNKTMPQTSSRKNERNPRSHQNTTFNNYQEVSKPRRYSSLRQRQTDSPVDKQSSSQYSRRSHNTRYSNFAKPVEPSRTANFTNQNQGNNSNLSNQTQTIKEEVQQQRTPAQPAVQQPVLSQSPSTNTVSQAQSNSNQPVSYSGPPPTNISAPLDPSLMQMSNMPLPYAPMLNPMYLEAAAYQRMFRMMSQQMSQMSVDQLPQLPSGLPPSKPRIPKCEDQTYEGIEMKMVKWMFEVSLREKNVKDELKKALDRKADSEMDTSGSAIPPNPQSLPHPTDIQVNPLLPPVSQPISQGSLGSIMRPPPPPINPPTYFTGPMGMANMNVGSMPQQPFYPPSLVAQQVGGVTYFNTQTRSPPTLPPAPNQQGSPRRNAAIPIMAPMGVGGIPPFME